MYGAPGIDSNATIGRYCGSSSPADIVSPDNNMFVTFSSDDYQAKKLGFTAEVIFIGTGQ